MKPCNLQPRFFLIQLSTNDPGGSRKANFSKSSNLNKTSARSKGSLRRFQRRSFHLKRTPCEKVIAFCSMRSTGKIGKKRCHVAPLTGWHMESVLYRHDDMACVQTNERTTHGMYRWMTCQPIQLYGPIQREHVFVRRVCWPSNISPHGTLWLVKSLVRRLASMGFDPWPLLHSAPPYR